MTHEVENGYYSIQVMNCTIHGKKHGVWDVWQTLEADVPYTFDAALLQLIDALEIHGKYRVDYINRDAGTVKNVTGLFIDAVYDNAAQSINECNAWAGLTDPVEA
jgi:hypothetical protein